MIELRTRCLASVLAVLAAAPQASPQTVPGPPGHAFARKTGKAGNSAGAAASPGLCFQPGVGWQRNVTGQRSESAARERHTSLGRELSGSASGANPQSVDARPSSTKRAPSMECPGTLTEETTGVERLTILHPRSTSRSAGETKPGSITSVTSLRADTLFQTSEGAGLKSLKRTPGAAPSAAKTLWSKAGPVEPSDDGNDRRFHAYISSVKLRRSIRSAPDFRTRSKLQQLENNSATQLPKATVDAKTGQGAKGSLHGERGRRTSSQKPDAHERLLEGLNSR
jgi:hypothetical protein